MPSTETIVFPSSMTQEFDCTRYRAAYGNGDDARHTMMPIKGYEKTTCGKFIMSGDALKHYYKEVVVGGKSCRLTEMQPCKDTFDSGKLCVDLDFRLSKETIARPWDAKFVDRVCDNLLSAILVHCNANGLPDTPIYVSAKPDINRTELDHANKDGLHLVYAANVPYSVRSPIRDTFIALCDKDKLFKPFCTNDTKDIVDAGPLRGSTQWTLYGSRKDGQEPYQLIATHTAFGGTKPASNADVDFDTFKKMCVRTLSDITLPKHTPEEVQENKRKFGLAKSVGRPKKEPAAKKDNSAPENAGAGQCEEEEPCRSPLDEMRDLLRAILDEKPDAFDEHIEWCKMGFAVADFLGDDGLSLFKEISLLTHSDTGKKHDEAEQETQYAKHDPNAPTKLGIGTMYHMLKELNPKHPLLQSNAAKEKYLKIADNEVEAATMVIEKMKDDIIVCRGKIYTKANNLWTCDKERVRITIRNAAATADLHIRIRVFGKEFIVPFGTGETHLSNTYKLINGGLAYLHAPQNNDFETLLRTSSVGYLCFEDGVLDMKLGIFTPWNEVQGIYTSIHIPMEIGEWWNDLKQEKTRAFNIRETLYEPVFGQDTDIALHFFARAVAGCKDKVFLEHTATRNCGKSTLLHALMNAFGDYVAPFSLNHLTKQGDDPKDFGWLVRLGDARLAVNQEVDEDKKINNAMLKSVVGGDNIEARELYSNGGKTKSIASFASFGNNRISFNSTGDASETMLNIFQTRKFVSKEEFERIDAHKKQFYMIGNPDILRLINEPEFKRQHIWTLVQKYQSCDKPVPIVRQLEDGEKDECEHIQLPDLLEQFLLFTGKKDDLVLIDDVYSRCFKQGYADKKYITKLLKDRFKVIKTKSNTKELRNKYVFQGVKLNPDYEEEEFQL